MKFCIRADSDYSNSHIPIPRLAAVFLLSTTIVNQ